MRIIAGKYKGRKLFFPKSEAKLRPTAARTKEALFCMIQSGLAGAEVLDLFAGTGALGLEALSRGAIRAVFADIDPSYVIKNLELAGLPKDGVIKGDYRAALDKLEKQDARFDFIFLDPPYDTEFGGDAIRRIIDKGLLKPDGKIILEHRSVKELPNFGECVRIYDTRAYGTGAVTFFGRLSQ